MWYEASGAVHVKNVCVVSLEYSTQTNSKAEANPPTMETNA